MGFAGQIFAARIALGLATPSSRALTDTGEMIAKAISKIHMAVNGQAAQSAKQRRTNTVKELNKTKEALAKASKEVDQLTTKGLDSAMRATAKKGGKVGRSFREQGGEDADVELKSVDALEDSLKDLSSMDGRENSYVEIPKLDLKHIIISNEKIHDGIRESFTSQSKHWDESDHVFLQDLFEESDSQFVKFKKSAQKEVSYLVKEFECRKSADAYARSTTARTGVLDTVKLHTYKFNEDLFKKVTVVPDGKNHGLIFILDWSGSMSQVMMDTVKQLYNLLWFCKKVQRFMLLRIIILLLTVDIIKMLMIKVRD